MLPKMRMTPSEAPWTAARNVSRESTQLPTSSFGEVVLLRGRRVPSRGGEAAIWMSSVAASPDQPAPSFL